MRKTSGNLLEVGAVCGMLMVINPFISLAAIGPGFTAGTYAATTTAESVNVNKSQDSEEILMVAKTGNMHEVLEDMGNGWMKARVNDFEGLLPVSDNATVEQVGENKMAEVQQDAVESSDTYKRRQVVNYIMQFVGGRYKYNGSDSRTGTDYSGFIRYVPQNSVDISTNRSSGGRARQGIAASADQIQPGDLVFYGSGRNINHVAVYIGNGQIIHTSTERISTIVSNRNYRNPTKIVNALGQDSQYK